MIRVMIKKDSVCALVSIVLLLAHNGLRSSDQICVYKKEIRTEYVDITNQLDKPVSVSLEGVNFFDIDFRDAQSSLHKLPFKTLVPAVVFESFQKMGFEYLYTRETALKDMNFILMYPRLRITIGENNTPIYLKLSDSYRTYYSVAICSSENGITRLNQCWRPYHFRHTDNYEPKNARLEMFKRFIAEERSISNNLCVQKCEKHFTENEGFYESEAVVQEGILKC